MHAALFGSGPLFTSPHHDYAGLEYLPRVRRARAGLRAARRRCRAAVCSSSRPASGGFPIGEFWHPVLGAPRLRRGRTRRTACARRRVRRDRRRSRRSPRARHPGRAPRGEAREPGGSRSASGTSGGTLAPILLISGAFGALVRDDPPRADPRLRPLTGRARARRDGRDLRRGDARDVHRDRVRVRAHPRLPGDPPAHARHRARRPRVPLPAASTAS